MMNRLKKVERLIWSAKEDMTILTKIHHPMNNLKSKDIKRVVSHRLFQSFLDGLETNFKLLQWKSAEQVLRSWVLLDEHNRDTLESSFYFNPGQSNEISKHLHGSGGMSSCAGRHVQVGISSWASINSAKVRSYASSADGGTT